MKKQMTLESLKIKSFVMTTGKEKIQGGSRPTWFTRKGPICPEQ